MDHCQKVSTIKKKTELKSGRQTKQLATILEFMTDIQHVTGKENVEANTLSRIPPFRTSSSDAVNSFKENSILPGFFFNSVNTVQPGFNYQALALHIGWIVLTNY